MEPGRWEAGITGRAVSRGEIPEVRLDLISIGRVNVMSLAELNVICKACVCGTDEDGLQQLVGLVVG